MNGELDVALLPVADLLRSPELQIVSDCCIAASSRVDSVLLLLRRAPHLVRTLVLDPSSRSSQLLARLCLRERYGVIPELREAEPLQAWRSGESDAVLVIGDVALELLAEDPPRLDLASEWYAITGRPFVFAVWAGRRDVLARMPELPHVLEAARDAGIACTRDLARAGALESQLPEDVVQVYLEERIRYRLAAPEREGLARFLDMARTLPSMPRESQDHGVFA
jgi:chorismate dehydratase